MAGKHKRPYIKKYFHFGCGAGPNASNLKGLQPRKKAMLEEAMKKILGKSSRNMISYPARKSNYSTENSVSPDDPASDRIFRERHMQHSAGKTYSRIFQTQLKKKGRKKNVAQFAGTSKNPRVANGKESEDRNISSKNPMMEYLEYTVAVTSHWDKDFVKKFSTKNYLLETQRQLQDIYCSKKLFASLEREQLLGKHVETSEAQPDHLLAAEHEHISKSPQLSDGPFVTLSPQIPLPTPILDPLQYLKKFFPISEDKTQNIPCGYLYAPFSDVGLGQQMLDDIQKSDQDGNRWTMLEPYSTGPLLSAHTLNAEMCDPGESKKIYTAEGLYVPRKFSFFTDTADVNFKYYPHKF